jgi:hypothetical protein
MNQDAKTVVVETNDLDEILDFLIDADVLEGAPELREIVEELWPELLHKVKPPLSQMH